MLADNGLRRGENDLQVIMMCELPSNAVIADAFLDHFDGFSIGSNDMTQLTLGLDRDSALVAAGFDERDAAVKFMISTAIKACKARGKYVGICGQGPSDHPDLAEWLLDVGGHVSESRLGRLGGGSAPRWRSARGPCDGDLHGGGAADEDRLGAARA